MFDCNSSSGYTPYDSADPLTARSLTVQDDNVFDIVGTCDNVADEWTYYESPDLSSLSVSTSIFPYYLIHWKTSVQSSGLGAKLRLIWTDATNETILGAANPQFNTQWSITAGTLTSVNKTLKYINFYADDYADSVASGTYHVYYDFFMLCKGIFTFPFVNPGGVSVKFPKKISKLIIPGRDTDILQDLGRGNAEIMLRGEMDTNTSWGTVVPGQYLYYILKDQSVFQWFTSDMINCKVKVRPEGFEVGQESGVRAQRTWQLNLQEYSGGDLSGSLWLNPEWFGKQA